MDLNPSSGATTKISKDSLISQLTKDLNILRTKANLTQEELANAIGISRQTYCQVENGNTKMSWSVYLSLLLFFSSLPETNELLQALGIYANEIMKSINEEVRS